ncbi:MAG: hypothetical protein QXN96_01420 [Candidatus Bathyarchaeia archaeon]
MEKRKERTKVVCCRVPEQLANLIHKLCERDMHLNPADFIRDAIREKIYREYSDLFKQMLQESFAKTENNGVKHAKVEPEYDRAGDN